MELAPTSLAATFAAIMVALFAGARRPQRKPIRVEVERRVRVVRRR